MQPQPPLPNFTGRPSNPNDIDDDDDINVNPRNNNEIFEVNDPANENMMLWRERERRQRTFRVLIMFLLMLLLMDGEEDQQQQQAEFRSRYHNPNHPRMDRNNLRHNNPHFRDSSSTQNSIWDPPLSPSKKKKTPKWPSLLVWQRRQAQEETLRQLTQQHPRYRALVEKNQQRRIDVEIHDWLHSIVDAARRKFNVTANEPVIAHESDLKENIELKVDEDANKNEKPPKVWTYPWNATGFYRGQWKVIESDTLKNETVAANVSISNEGNKTQVKNFVNHNYTNYTLRQPPELEDVMLQIQHKHSLLQEKSVWNLTASSIYAHPDKPQIIPGGPLVASVHLLPEETHLKIRDDHNLTKLQWDQMTVDSNGILYSPDHSDSESKQDPTDFGLLSKQNSGKSDSLLWSKAIRGAAKKSSYSASKHLPLTLKEGRAAIQLYSRSIPGMKELSLVDGFLKLYDSNSPGYPTRNDLLLRVRGVLIHAIGHLSLVSSNVPVTQHALVLSRPSIHADKQRKLKSKTKIEANDTKERIHSQEKDKELATEAKLELLDGAKEATMKGDLSGVHRRLSEAIKNLDSANMKDVRRDAQLLAEGSTDWKPLLQTADFGELDNRHRSLEEETITEANNLDLARSPQDTVQENTTLNANLNHTEAPELPLWSNVVIPFPYIHDDDDESVRKSRTAGSRRMPAREQKLEANGLNCPFEVTLNVEETEWTLAEWRTLLKHKWNEQKRLDPANPINEKILSNSTLPRNATKATKSKNRITSSSHSSTTPYRSSSKKWLVSDEALVMNMLGSIYSKECNFHATVNVTALRTDWDVTTSKAINYSFYMMLVCLAQIILLLRQLLHSQTNSGATRVSMLCIGWQCVIDALICLGHIYLCLAMQPLFTAFASVSFFKLLIFCVIEMKYMAIILQARGAANGGTPTDVLRRQVAILHVRFYLALLAVFIFLWNVDDKYRTLYMLALYSFWIPQIVLNVITQAKTPMHKYFIYGMSFSRMVVPLYIYAMKKNFLKEVYPEAPYDPWTCQCLVLWVTFQTAILIGQSKYGARFMIPARFLPPKYDYSRPIPPSVLNNAVTGSNTTTEEIVDTAASRPTDRHATSVTTRNRIRNRSQHGRSASAVTEDPTITALSSTATTTTTTTVLECCICYENIDVMRQSYMLAPCNHLFHRDCLIQWMDIKMECPTCRTELPAL